MNKEFFEEFNCFFLKGVFKNKNIILLIIYVNKNKLLKFDKTEQILK